MKSSFPPKTLLSPPNWKLYVSISRLRRFWFNVNVWFRVTVTSSSNETTFAAAAVLIPWSDVTLLGPYIPGEVGNNAQPDWFLFWLEGALRIFPPIEFGIPGTFVVSGPFIAGVVLPGLIFTFLALYPFLEKRVYKLSGEWHVLQNPLEIPLRAGTMLGVFSALLILSAAATNDILSRMFGVPIEVITWISRVAVIVVPVGLGVGLARLSRRRLDRRGRTVPQNAVEEQQRYIAA